jgi:very-short-patch-repair endonuclease
MVAPVWYPVDAMPKLCTHPACSKQAHFNVAGQPPRFCAAHKSVEMMDVVIPRCDECDTQAHYALRGDRPHRCGDHRDDGMICVGRECRNASCATAVTYKCFNNGYCVRCHLARSPAACVGATAAREWAVQDALTAAFPDRIVEFNKSIPRTGLKYQVDARVCDDRVLLIVEVDDNQHRIAKYARDDERVAKIHAANIKGLTRVVRINPDAYTSSTGQFIPSCFARVVDEHGKTRVMLRVSEQTQWAVRLDALVAAIKMALDNVDPRQPLVVTRLFFDGHPDQTDAASDASSTA